ncbi:MAG: fructosamine kinase family protein [Woeseia sp.]
MPNWDSVATVLAAAGIRLDQAHKPVAVAGGDISAAWRAPTDSGAVFLKTGTAADIEMFCAERDALAALAATQTVQVPAALALGTDGRTSLLALEWLDLESATTAASRRFGQQLALLHRQTAADFGWHRDNFIGRTPQRNTRRDNWQTFFRECRLEYQLELAAQKGYGGELQSLGAWLCANLATLFAGYEPQPSLLHGDLWGGNWAASAGEPVMFDPAAYYGDRETDLAMTRLFGGFPAAFYEAYEASWPLTSGAAERVALYQLYHVLNHLNLFGGSYEGSALGLLRKLRGFIER